jgi:hypothetical protein
VALGYNLQPELEGGTREAKVIDGMCRVNHIALGCAVIRDAFESLIAAGMVRLRPDRFLQNRSYRKVALGAPSTISLARSRSRTAITSRKTAPFLQTLA